MSLKVNSVLLVIISKNHPISLLENGQRLVKNNDFLTEFFFWHCHHLSPVNTNASKKALLALGAEFKNMGLLKPARCYSINTSHVEL